VQVILSERYHFSSFVYIGSGRKGMIATSLALFFFYIGSGRKGLHGERSRPIAILF